MSGKLPRQQQSRPRNKDVDVISKEEAKEILKDTRVEDIEEGLDFFSRQAFETDDTDEEGEEDGEHS